VPQKKSDMMMCGSVKKRLINNIVTRHKNFAAPYTKMLTFTKTGDIMKHTVACANMMLCNLFASAIPEAPIL
jgi:hypothetical protein